MNYQELANDNHWGLSAEDIKTIETSEDLFDTGRHWTFMKVGDQYEATYDGLYMHVFSNIKDFLARENEVDYYEYCEVLSDERGQETFVNSEGKIREY